MGSSPLVSVFEQELVSPLNSSMRMLESIAPGTSRAFVIAVTASFVESTKCFVDIFRVCTVVYVLSYP